MNAARIPGSAETVEAWRAGLLDRLIADVLRPVIGEPFMDLGRAADLIWLGFGEKVDAPTRRDPERRTARHRLHVMCPFRLESNDAILVAASDIYRPVGAIDSIENFEWDKPRCEPIRRVRGDLLVRASARIRCARPCELRSDGWTPPRSVERPHDQDLSQPLRELYPEVVDACEEEGVVPSRLLKTDAGDDRQEGTSWRMFACSPSGRATRRSRSR